MRPTRTSLAVLALILVGCAAGGEPSATTATDPPPTGPDDGPVTTARPFPLETLVVETSPGIATTVFRPIAAVPGPAVVLVPGGGWRSADPEGLVPMAQEIAGHGVAVYLTTYDLDAETAFGQIACVVAVARREAGDDGGTVVLTGHSVGAQLTATVALGGDRFSPVGGCAAPSDAYRPPDAWVGISGPYEIKAIAALGGLPALDRFLGGGLAEAPDAWDRADPFSYVAAAPGADLSLVHGRADIVVFPVSTERFSDALTGAGGDPVTVYVEGADHNDVYDPADAGAEAIRLILAAAARAG